MTEIFKAVLLGIIEGITEWLPISSTGHMILVDEIIKMKVSAEFREMFLVVVQLGAILAVVLLFWGKIWPFCRKDNPEHVSDSGILTFCHKNTWLMWFKVLAGCIPAIIVGLLFDELFERLFYNPVCVALALIIFGIAFIMVENYNKKREPMVTDITQLTYRHAVIIGCFQVLAAVFPGTSRSGATIIGALLIGISRPAAAEFTFVMSIPVMFGASLLKMVKFGFSMTGFELIILCAGMASAFLVSVIVIHFFMSYIRKHDFKVFGWYRIALGIIVLVSGMR